MSKNRSLFTVCLTVLVISVSVFYFSRLYLEKVCDTFEVQIDLTAENRDTLVLFSPDEKGRFNQKNSINVRYGPGKQSIIFPFELKYTDMPLRFDPGFKRNSITIHSISMSRFSNVEIHIADELKSYVADTAGLTKTLSENGLRLVFEDGDPQIILKGFSLSSGGYYKVIAYCILFVVVGVVCLLISPFLVSKRWLPQALIALMCFGLFSGGYLLDLKFAIVVSLFSLVLYHFLKIIQTIFRQGDNSFKAPPLGAIVVVGCFFILIIGPFYKAVSFKSTFVTSTPDLLGKVMKDEDTIQTNGKIRTFIHSFEDSFFSNFPYRKQLINLNAKVKIFYLGFTPNTKSILGKEGMFFEGYGERRVESDVIGSFDNITDYMGLIPFTEKELFAWLLSIEERYYWLKEQGTDYVFALAPTKALIYPEYLPSRILNVKEKLNKATRYEQLINYLKVNSIVPIVDLRTELLSAKDDLKQKGITDDYLLYYRTDFHWNYLGSFLAYQAIVKIINEAYPKYRFNTAQLEEFSIHKRTDWVHVNFIYSLGLNPAEHTDETYLTFYPKKSSVYNKIGSYGEKGISDYSTPLKISKDFGGKKIPLRELENKEAKTPLIYIMGDSFSNKFFGYFSKHAKKTVRFRGVYGFQPEMYTEAKPDLVIQEMLSMYLLEKPPSNPASIKGARERALASSVLGKHGN